MEFITEQTGKKMVDSRFEVTLTMDVDDYYLTVNGLRDHGCASCIEQAEKLMTLRRDQMAKEATS